MITTREKYIKMYERFIELLRMYANVIRILSKVYLPVLLLPLSTLHDILAEVKKVIQTTKRDYDIVIK